jgi:lipopolysaccharide/colanic/teichoic acid biosynthesis glycosyltransferase
MHTNTEIDLFYVQNYSILLDIQILLRTLGAVIRGKGAF